MADSERAQRPHFTVAGEPIDLVRTTDWTFREAQQAKHVSGGMSVAAIERGFTECDPDAMLAIAVVSIRRKRGGAEIDVEKLLDAFNPVEMLSEIADSLEAPAKVLELVPDGDAEQDGPPEEGADAPSADEPAESDGH